MSKVLFSVEVNGDGSKLCLKAFDSNEIEVSKVELRGLINILIYAYTKMEDK